MDNKTLKILLDKYYRGETALGEEKLLQQYFNKSEDAMPDFETDRLLIKLSQSVKESEKDAAGIEDRFSAYIDDKLSGSPIPGIRRSISRFAVAASIALIVGASAFFIFRFAGKSPQDTYSDPGLAYQEVENTLVFVSGKINSGIEPLSNIDKIRTGTEPLRALEEIESNLKVFGLFSFVNQTSSLK